ncbi:MAG: F0F1 ATP synthase subunit B [Oscillospiraceae bacterium]|nr:F0F1 ATP synthase subunit B [Oscillospiraceae bacterium]
MVFLTAAETKAFISIDIWTCLFMLGNLLLLYWLMKKFLFGPIRVMIVERQKEIDDLYADANQSKADAAELKDQYEARLAEANEEKEEILRTAYRKAQLREEEILREAQDKAAATLKRADAQIELEKKRALNEIKDDVSTMAVDIASAVLSRDIRPKEHTALIDSFIENLGENHD